LASRRARGNEQREALSRESATSLDARQRLICAQVVSPEKNEFFLEEKFLNKQGQKEFKALGAKSRNYMPE